MFGSVELAVKELGVWGTGVNQPCKIIFSCLNMIDDYNLGVEDVDVADQLQLVYKSERFLQNQK